MRRALTITLAVLALVVVAVAALIGYVVSDRGLSFVVERLVARSGGHVEVEEPTGSIAGTMRFRRITWRGEDATVIADDVVVEWNPGALWSKRLSIRGLGARRLDIAIKPSSGAPTQPPTDLRPPIAIDITRLTVGELLWQTGPRSGRITGLEFGYTGDNDAHRVRMLRLVSEYGSLAGNVEVGAVAPIPIRGDASIVGDAALAAVRATAMLTGDISHVGIDARGNVNDAGLRLQTTATPFAAAPFETFVADASDVDVRAFEPSLPHTRVRAHVDGRLQGNSIAGTVSVENADAGPVDSERLPVVSLASQFAVNETKLALTMLDAKLADQGSLQGSGAVTLGDARSATFALDVRDVDLARIHTKLVRTRLAGRLSGEASAQRQVLEGDVRDRDIGLAFNAVIDASSVDVSRFRATTAGGALRGSAKVALNDTNSFSVQAAMERLDPSRFVAMPAARLDGAIKASGVIRPQWRVDGEAVVANTSRVGGIATSGRLKGVVQPGVVRDATVDVTLASAKLHATGSIDKPSDRVTFTADIPRLAEISALLPGSVPKPTEGELHASGIIVGSTRIPGGEITVRGRALRAGRYAAESVQGHASLAPLRSSNERIDDRALSFDLTATQVKQGERVVNRLTANATGSIARHRATAAVAYGEIDANLAVEGSLTKVGTADTAWNGTLVSLSNRGAVPLTLQHPASLALHQEYVRLTNAHIDVAAGDLDVTELTIDHGRITTRGAFSNLAVANVAKLAGQSLPIDTTLIVAGDWSIAAAPTLNGTFSIRRERGDIFAVLPDDTSTSRRPLGVSTLMLSGRFDNDALDANASFAAERAGNATATVSIGAGSGVSTGKIDKAAPLRLAIRGDLASLAVFQPWFGTTAALGGRARIDVAATGTVGEPLWSGSVVGEGLRIDAPQYGFSANNGRLRAHLASNGVAIDEVYLAAGEGTFTADGLIALPTTRSAEAATRVRWKADKFRATNRPDLHLVVDGEGAIVIENKRLSLTGNVAIVEGHVEYNPSPSGELASDIVIKGRTPPSRREGPRDLPLALDVDVDFGRKLTFAGSGIDTGLAGRVKITTSQSGSLLGRGTIRAVNGTYYAFGQKLTIDRGRLIFDGALDDPALDIVALRKNLPVEAGVELTGTVKVPQIRITSNPPVPENEALSWLVTGQAPNNLSRVDYGTLSAASAVLLGKSGKPLSTQIAQKLGLDDISVQSSGTATGTDGAPSQVVVFGKRISDRLSLGYEQGLSVASSAVRLEYALSRRVTIRAEAGQVSGIGIVYRRNFE